MLWLGLDTKTTWFATLKKDHVLIQYTMLFSHFTMLKLSPELWSLASHSLFTGDSWTLALMCWSQWGMGNIAFEQHDRGSASPPGSFEPADNHKAAPIISLGLLSSIIMCTCTKLKQFWFLHFKTLISIYIWHTKLSITVMVIFYSHKRLYQSALFCSEISYSDVQKRVWFE